jgi:hypothetical protein
MVPRGNIVYPMPAGERIEGTGRYLGIEVDDAMAIAKQIDLTGAGIGRRMPSAPATSAKSGQ